MAGVSATRRRAAVGHHRRGKSASPPCPRRWFWTAGKFFWPAATMPAACCSNSRIKAASSRRKRSGSSPPKFSARPSTRPIFHDGHVFGTRPDGQFVCLGLDGKVLWASPAGDSFGLGPFLFADGLFFVMNDSGKLSLVEDSTSRFNQLAPGASAPGPRVLGADGPGRRTPDRPRPHPPGLPGRLGRLAAEMILDGPSSAPPRPLLILILILILIPVSPSASFSVPLIPGVVYCISKESIPSCPACGERQK